MFLIEPGDKTEGTQGRRAKKVNCWQEAVSVKTSREIVYGVFTQKPNYSL